MTIFAVGVVLSVDSMIRAIWDLITFYKRFQLHTQLAHSCPSTRMW